MVVDLLKSCYKTTMRVRLDPELILPVRWYFCPPGALPLPTETAFGSSVWETDDREYPQPGLGEVSLERTFDSGKAPPNVTGLSTPTPLDFFVNGLPSDYAYPPPNGGNAVMIVLREEASCVAGEQSTLTDEGALGILGEEMPHVRGWQFLLFVWPPAVDDSTEFADLQEAVFPGYSRIVPTWTDPVIFAPSQATTDGSTVSWTLGGAVSPPVTVFGWAAVAPGLPGVLRSVQLFDTPITLRNPGDNVTLCPVQLLMGECQPEGEATLNVCPNALGPQCQRYRVSFDGFVMTGPTNPSEATETLLNQAPTQPCQWGDLEVFIGPGGIAATLTFTAGGGATVLFTYEAGDTLIYNATYSAPAPVDPAGPITLKYVSNTGGLLSYPPTVTVFCYPYSDLACENGNPLRTEGGDRLALE